MRDEIEAHDRVYLEKLSLATEILLRLAEDPGALPNALESDLYLLRDRIDRALLLPPEAPAPAAQAAGATRTDCQRPSATSG